MGEIIFKATQVGRLDTVLGTEPAVIEALQGFSRSQAGIYIENGQVYLNDRQLTKPSYKVNLEDTIRVVTEEKKISHPAFEKDLEIYFEDEHLLVLNKPTGLSVHPGAGNPDKTLVNALVHHYTQNKGSLPAIFQGSASERVGIVHRIDKDTSGVLVVAKTLEVLQALQKQFQDHTVERQYVALCLTSPRSKSPLVQTEEGTIEGTIRRSINNRKAFELVKEGSVNGKFSKTNWKVLERYPYAILVACKLATGRTHQIRVHLRASGCPLAGDLVYHSNMHLPKALSNASDVFGRQALHAASLGFIHPVTSEKLFFEAPIPADLQKLITLFKEWKGIY